MEQFHSYRKPLSLWQKYLKNLLVSLALVCMLLTAPLEGATPDVLILHSYNDGMPWTDSLNRGILKAFREKSVRAEYFFEYMDSKRFTYKGYFDRLAGIFEQKYRDTHFDLVISTDDNAYLFLVLHGDELFPGVPFLFCGVNDPSQVMLNNNRNITGIMENIDISGTLNIARTLHPEAERIILISDYTDTGSFFIRRVRDDFKLMDVDMEVTELFGLTSEELKTQLASLDDRDSIILYFAFFRDGNGKILTVEESLRLIATSSRHPVYSFWDFLVDVPAYPALGGSIIMGEKYGLLAGRQALRILEEGSVDTFPIKWDGAPVQPGFNYPAMKRFSIREDEIPTGSRIFRRPDSFFQKYRHFLIINILFGFSVVLLISFLMMIIFRRKKAERELRKEKHYWENLFEYSPEAIGFSDTRGKLKKVNRKFLDLFGYREEEVLGRSLDSLFARSRQQFEESAAMSRKIKEGQTVTLESERTGKDGATVPVIMMGVPLKLEGDNMASFTIFRDITRQKKAEAEIIHRLNFEEILSRTSSRLVFVQNLERTVLESLEEIRIFLGCSDVFVARFDRPRGTLEVLYESMDPGSESLEKLGDLHLTRFTTIMKDLRTKGQFLMQEFGSLSLLDPLLAEMVEKRHTNSLLILPLYLGKNLEGMVGFENIWSKKEWNDWDLNLLQTLCDLLGEALRRKGSAEKLNSTVKILKNSFEGTFRTMTKILEIKDPYTAGHQLNVTRLATAIAAEMGLTGDILDGIYYASLVHDIGKINIPTEILSKPIRLSEIEFSLIRNHTRYGWEILHNIYFPWPIADIVLQHHERLDGSGYPQGLKGDEILLEARIITVADVVEAMSSDRPYRPSLGIGNALDEIEAHSGQWFMPEAVQACTKLFREKSFSFIEEIADDDQILP